MKLSSGNAYVLFSRNKFSSFLNTLPIFFLPPIHQPIDKKLGPLEVIICFQSPCFRLVLERCRIRKYFVNLPIPVEVVWILPRHLIFATSAQSNNPGLNKCHLASFAEKKRDLLTPSNEIASGGSAGNFKENYLSSYTPHGCFFLWLSSRRPHLCPDEFTCYQLKNKCAKFILFTAFWRWEGGGGGSLDEVVRRDRGLEK